MRVPLRALLVWRLSEGTQGLGLVSTGVPPRGADLVREFAVRPTGDDWFADEADDLSRAYRDLPALDPAVVDLWQELGERCSRQAAHLRRDFDIEVVDDYDPYRTSAEMLDDIAHGRYRVTTLHSNHPIWGVDSNVDFRIAHDLLGHGRSGADFSFKGEVEAYQSQCTSVPERLWPVLFTEIVGQVAYSTVHHLFGEQKVGLLPLTIEDIAAHVDKVMDAPGPDDAAHQSL